MTELADRNLLFGVLALQLDFIHRDALIAGMNAWLLDKQRTLGEILVERGSLDKAHEELLFTLVRAHLKQHGDDSEKSLAALSSITSIRADLGQLTDPSITASVRRLPDVAPACPDATLLPQPPGESSSSASRRFRILRPHARGGLGVVHVALDEELHREVALKEIQREHADDSGSRARFILEAQITGSLEHPGIVPVYGLGQYADGRPFYAMRFIRGDSLKEGIERFHGESEAKRTLGERELELRKLLGRFIDVCDAMQYAHDRGVLHRDLKPGNIMLGRYGETLVVDWGLAKAAGKFEGGSSSEEATFYPVQANDSSCSQTVAGETLGTPQYMSPEQACGRVKELGPLSDVYSLGATLYCLLTGRPPYEGTDVLQLLARVKQGDFPAPRQVRSSVPHPLEAICLKAMALRPEDRYPSPGALARDLENWLGDEPVLPWREPLMSRLIRWARHHRVAVEVLGILIGSGIIVALLGAWWQHQEAFRERHLRVVSESLRNKGMRVAAQFAARSIAHEVDLRWWMLKGAAEDSELRRLVSELSRVEKLREHPDQIALQSWVCGRYEESQRARASAWFVTDDHGRQLAREPVNPKTVGMSFAYRDYFHGEGRDYPEGTQRPSIRDIHRSLVFESKVTKNRTVAFTVPIWSDKPKESTCLGVLGMTVEVGAFAGLEIDRPVGGTSDHQDRIAVLVDLKQDGLDGTPQNGLVLQHPYLDRLRQNKQTLPVIRIEAERTRHLEELRRKCLANELIPESDFTERNYIDPVGGEFGGQWLATFSPVFIEGLTGNAEDTGWCVIIQER